jgi:hypothetical protein
MTFARRTACPPITKRSRFQPCLLDGSRPSNSMHKEALLFLPTDGAEWNGVGGRRSLPSGVTSRVVLSSLES